MVQIVLAEDDFSISEPLTLALSREGYDVVVLPDGPGALEAATEEPVDLLLLDLGLPMMDGLEVCRSLRARGVDVPVLVLTARDSEADTVAALDAGADDYVTKPFRLGELLARVRALLRRGGVPDEPGPRGVRLDEAARRAWVDSREVALTVKEFDVLRVLVREQGSVVGREELVKEVWETDWVGSTKSLDVHVSSLRRKLRDDPFRPRYITTVRGVGFRFERP